MSKLPLSAVTSLTNESTALSTINSNWTAITAAFDLVLSRDGTLPNSMSANFDMNSFNILNCGTIDMTGHALLNMTTLDMHSAKITNLGAPTVNTDAARLVDIITYVNGGYNVGSVFGRTGVVVAVTGDYTVSQVTGAAPLASPALTGVPTAPTAAALTSTTQIATTAFVQVSYAPLASPVLTGTPTAPTAAVDTNTLQLANTAFVLAQASAVTPLGNNSTAAIGTSTRYARADHVHPGRTVLTTTTTFYVRTDGNDSNTGLVNSAGGAFLTLTGAYNAIVSRYDFGGQSVILQIGVASSTFTTGLSLAGPWTGGGTFSFNGNSSTISVSANGASPIAVSCVLPGIFYISSITLAGSGTFSFGVYHGGVGTIQFQSGIVFGAFPNTAGFQMFASGTGAFIHAGAGFKVIGSASNCFSVSALAGIYMAGAPLVFTGRIVYSSFGNWQQISNSQADSMTFTGTSTFTVTLATPAVVTATAHGLSVGDPWVPNTSGALPTGMTARTTYYVIATGFGVNSFQFSATPGGAAINTSGSQSGTHNWFSVTGSRYTITQNSNVATSGAGATYFPGSTAGSTSTGGQYS